MRHPALIAAIEIPCQSVGLTASKRMRRCCLSECPKPFGSCRIPRVASASLRRKWCVSVSFAEAIFFELRRHLFQRVVGISVGGISHHLFGTDVCPAIGRQGISGDIGTNHQSLLGRRGYIMEVYSEGYTRGDAFIELRRWLSSLRNFEMKDSYLRLVVTVSKCLLIRY